jgi:hypothetical protein
MAAEFAPLRRVTFSIARIGHGFDVRAMSACPPKATKSWTRHE